jgi:CheY-like chemotaxis protein
VRILIVDDNQDAAELLAMALEASGHDTRAVFDGTSAVSTTSEWNPDVVLLDIGLPDIDGYEAAVRIRATGRAPTLIALTGHAETDRNRTAEAGFVCHLVKPVSLETLHATLRDVVARP